MSSDFKILCHHVYEYHKGLRQLVLHTISADELEEACRFLQARGICHFARPVGEQRINLFFGDPVCVRIAEGFGQQGLHTLSDEEDFILGIMLGYDRGQQCKRYLRRKGQQVPSTPSKENTLDHGM